MEQAITQNGTVAGKYDRGATAEDDMHSLNESQAGGTVGEIYVVITSYSIHYTKLYDYSKCINIDFKSF